ncbi:hypothetical protein NE237_014053 [Protea cynaroides]|uniref:Uncharacterized protein n=1 Tax=Protea cynaroides TaxID=273540 RepID=A0A9Q0H118_9MAGN|nr:hypothetical protein NE237_014053 [Protea cynaroides]
MAMEEKRYPSSHAMAEGRSGATAACFRIARRSDRWRSLSLVAVEAPTESVGVVGEQIRRTEPMSAVGVAGRRLQQCSVYCLSFGDYCGAIKAYRKSRVGYVSGPPPRRPWSNQAPYGYGDTAGYGTTTPWNALVLEVVLLRHLLPSILKDLFLSLSITSQRFFFCWMNESQ